MSSDHQVPVRCSCGWASAVAASPEVNEVEVACPACERVLLLLHGVQVPPVVEDLCRIEQQMESLAEQRKELLQKLGFSHIPAHIEWIDDSDASEENSRVAMAEYSRTKNAQLVVQDGTVWVLYPLGEPYTSVFRLRTFRAYPHT
jgi:hypothetical protein